MNWQPISTDQLRWAQLLTGLVLATWISVGLVPPLRKQANRLRGALLVFYLLACLGFIVINLF